MKKLALIGLAVALTAAVADTAAAKPRQNIVSIKDINYASSTYFGVNPERVPTGPCTRNATHTRAFCPSVTIEEGVENADATGTFTRTCTSILILSHKRLPGRLHVEGGFEFRYPIYEDYQGLGDENESGDGAWVQRRESECEFSDFVPYRLPLTPAG